MLNRTLAPLRAVSWSWAHVCVLLVGLMWLLPFLHYRHETPLTTYDQEWWSAALGLAAMTLLLGWRFWQQPSVPRITQVPLLLVVVVLLQVGLGKVVYFEQGLLYILYLLFAMLLMMLGAHLRANFGIERLALVLAVFLIVGAELDAIAGLIQHYRWNTPFNPYVVGKISTSVYGNLAQPNQFSNYLTLGLISIGLLYQQRKLPLLVLPLLVAPLLFTISLSLSRSPWLYYLGVILLAWFWMRRDQSMRRLLFYGLSVLAGQIAMIFIVQLPFFAGEDMLHRMFQDHASWVVRIYLWKESFNIFLSAPWLGVGFGQYAIHHFQWVPILRPESSHIVGMYNHAHNMVMQLAAESGVVGLLIVLGGVLLWLKGVCQARCTAAHWWAYSILLVLVIHSLLEYPLWYFYFLGIFAVLMGMLDETRYELELRQLGRVGVALILLLGSMSLYQVDRDYHRLKRTLATQPVNGNLQDARRRMVEGLLDIRNGSLMYPQAQLTLSVFRDAKIDENLKRKLELNTEAVRFVPLPAVVFQQAILLALDGQQEAAKRVLQQVVWSYPDNELGYQRLLDWAEKDPARFEPLVEYIDQQEEERASGIHR